ncbi:MAG: hypothetical protein DME69_11615 [Verrucomicrobia bacterium]|nr:MAG: hypothetical protein DME69_11615 [Verrucomicrobiota bacterium]
MANPLAGPDHEVAGWFHAHLTRTFVSVLRAFTEFGSSEWIGVVLFFMVLYFVWKKYWPSLVTLVVAVPGGMFLNEWVKLLVHRQRPFLEGPFVDWSGYSFASGHTIGATLLYGQLALFVLPAMKGRHWRRLTVASAALLIALVGFSRIALGAHFLTDVSLPFLLLANLRWCAWNRQKNPRKSPELIGRRAALGLLRGIQVFLLKDRRIFLRRLELLSNTR